MLSKSINLKSFKISKNKQKIQTKLKILLNEKNQLIHFICIPLIVTTISIFGCYTGELLSLPGNNYFVSELNLSALLTIFYSFYYIRFDMNLGLMMSGLLWINQIITYWLYCLFPGIWLNALYLHIACWLL